MQTQEREISNRNIDNTSNRRSVQKLKSSSHISEVLCKITFDLDDKIQQLLVYESTSLNELTQNLVQKLKKCWRQQDENEYHITEDDKRILKQQIKSKIEVIMEQNTEKTLQAAKWRNKLKQIVEQNIRTPMDSLVSPSSLRQTPTQSKSVSYFKYNLPQSQNDQNYPQREMFQRMKILDRQINREQRAKEDKKVRLYDLGKQTNLLKDYLTKIHEHEAQEEQLSECTFHPFVKKPNFEAKQHGNVENHSHDVFKRLYNQALQKKQKMKKIEVEVQNRQTQEYKHLNFIPQINSCSKDIIKAKKDQKSNIYQNLYQDMYIKEQKMKFQPEWTFHPTICPKSQKIVKRNQLNKANAKSGSQSSKHFFNELNMVKNQSTTELHRQGLKTEHSHSKSPISKNMSTKKLDKYRILRASDASIKQPRNQEDTLKKINCKSSSNYESQSTLKSSIFSKKAFKKQNKNGTKQFYKEQKEQPKWNCFVDSKDIKREKVIVSEQTIQTCNTEGAYPTCLSKISSDTTKRSCNQTSYPKNKHKTDPFSFFQQRQRLKKMNNINNKQNLNIVMPPKEEERSSQNEFQKRKNKIFEEIFDYLLYESKNQSQIYFDSIVESNSIPSTLKHIFLPMAEEMKQLNVGLDKQQFVWSMIRIFDSLTLQQRGWILAWGLKLQEPANETKNFR